VCVYCVCPFIKRFSQHEPFRSALNAFIPERNDRFLGETGMGIDYQRGWWSEPFHKERPMDAKDVKVLTRVTNCSADQRIEEDGGKWQRWDEE